MRNIDAEALAAKITAEKDEAVPNTPYDIGYNNGLSMAHAIVLAAPTIEEKRGRWIYKQYEEEEFWLYHCSECNALSASAKNYCPDCGAKMEVDDG